jgi:hypothetical protein
MQNTDTSAAESILFELLDKANRDYEDFCSIDYNEKNLNYCRKEKENASRKAKSTMDTYNGAAFACMAIFGEKFVEEFEEEYYSKN